MKELSPVDVLGLNDFMVMFLVMVVVAWPCLTQQVGAETSHRVVIIGGGWLLPMKLSRFTILFVSRSPPPLERMAQGCFQSYCVENEQ